VRIISFFKVSICLLVCLLCLPESSLAQDSNPDPEQCLYFTQWGGSFLSVEKRGVAAWIHDSAGNLRFEIMFVGQGQESKNLDRILNWSGPEGWTFISAASGAGTFSRWYEQWQEIPSSMDIWLRAIIAHTGGGLPLPTGVRETSPGGRTLLLPLFETAEKRTRVKKLQLPEFIQSEKSSEEPVHDFRQRMTRRGAGRGGPETVLNLVSSSGEFPDLRITSSRYPGSLHLGFPQRIAAEYIIEEVFLPWWPLSGIVNLKRI